MKRVFILSIAVAIGLFVSVAPANHPPSCGVCKQWNGSGCVPVGDGTACPGGNCCNGVCYPPQVCTPGDRTPDQTTTVVEFKSETQHDPYSTPPTKSEVWGDVTKVAEYRLDGPSLDESSCGGGLMPTISGGSPWTVTIKVSIPVKVFRFEVAWTASGGRLTYDLFNVTPTRCVKYYGKYWRQEKNHTISFAGTCAEYEYIYKDNVWQWYKTSQGPASGGPNSSGWKTVNYKTSTCSVNCGA